jgi:hypothetical protein
MLVFSFTDEFVNGQARLEYTMNGESQYVFMEKVGETYQTPVTFQLAQCGSIDLQLVITEGTDKNEIPKFKSNVFYLPFGKSINAEIEQPEEYEEWIDVANTKLNEVDNLNIEMQDNVVTITRKDGTTYSENVKGEPGIQGKPGSVKTIPVNEFPTENIELDAIYILPNPKPTSEKDKYQEFVYINGGWELFGGGSVGVDLSDYVKFTDYATSTKAGVVKINPTLGIAIYDGNISVDRANESEIDQRMSMYKAIVPSTLDYAVGSVKASQTQSGTIKAWASTNEDGEIGLNISTEV